MNSISVDYFLTLFEEFKCVNSAKINAFLSIASNRVPLSVWGKNAQYACALLAAHMLSSSENGGSGGALASETVGDLTQSFSPVGQAGSGDDYFRTTRYGIDYLALRSETVVPFFSLGEFRVNQSRGNYLTVC